MKILVLSNMYPSSKAPNYGTFVKNFCEQLDELDVDYSKVVMTKESNKIVSYLKYYTKMCFHILFNRFEIIYVHYASHNALPILFLSKIKKIKIYTNVHGGDVIPQTKIQIKMNRFTKRLLQISSKVIVPSLYFKKILIKDYNISQQKINIYPSAGVNNKLFYPTTINKNSNIIIAGKKIETGFDYIGFVGRLELGKGWRTFLKAIKILVEAGKMEDKKVIIVGNGNEFNEFNSLIKNLNLSKLVIHIKFLPQNELPIIYNLLSVFCFPSEAKESLGLVALEALACGIPVIASDSAAQKEYIIDGVNGYKFEKGNSVELANKIYNYFNLSNNEVLSIKSNAYKTASNYYSHKLKKQLEKIIAN